MNTKDRAAAAILVISNYIKIIGGAIILNENVANMIFTISESPLKFGVLYAGTDDGRVWMTLNSGEKWEEINKGLPYRKWVSHMKASRYAPGRVYMTQNGKRDDDFAAYIWKSEDYGKTWESIQNNLPYGPVNVIREDPRNENILYVGTDYGVFVSSDQGDSWQTLVADLPTTYVHDINIHQRDDIAVIATHGRGMWALDVRIMREVAEAAMEDIAAKILEIPEVYTPRGRWYWRNAPGLKIPFYLKKGETVTTIVSDTDGKIIFNEDQNAGDGLNYVNWNLQNHDKEFVEAGEYVVKIAGPGFEEEKKLEVKEFRRR
ncbi:MAG: VPS10 domain-containing protein [Draconibacterium sp.]